MGAGWARDIYLVLVLVVSKVQKHLTPTTTSTATHQPDHLAGLADDLEVLEALQEQGEVEGHDGGDVDQVHGVLDELGLDGADDEPDDVLDGEVDNDEVVDHVDDMKD